MSEYEKNLARAAKLCSATEKSRSDIIEKLVQWGMNESDREKAISYLEKNQFLDDRRYARYFVKDKFAINKWGKVKIRFALRRKEIPDSIIEEAMETIGKDNYHEMLDQMLAKKISSVGSIKTAANKAKVMRFAAQRGFTAEEIYASLQRLEND